MLLGVVEENRKTEVMDNLGVCAQLVEKIKNELRELEGRTVLNSLCCIYIVLVWHLSLSKYFNCNDLVYMYVRIYLYAENCSHSQSETY